MSDARDQIMDLLMDAPSTCDELADVLDLPRSTVGNALWELRRDGLIEDGAKEPRNGKIGREAIVYQMAKTKRAA